MRQGSQLVRFSFVALCATALSGCKYESTYCVSDFPTCSQLDQAKCEAEPICVWEPDCHHRACSDNSPLDCTTEYGCSWNDETKVCSIIEPGACSGLALGMGGGGCLEGNNCTSPRCEIRDQLSWCNRLDETSCQAADHCKLETVERSRRVGAILPRKWWNF